MHAPVIRRKLLAGLLGVAATALTTPLSARTLNLGAPVRSLMGQASDTALDRLAQPGAFLADEAIRIVLPGLGGNSAAKLLEVGDKLGVTQGLTKAINDAAGLAAAEAKPIFRTAIDNFGWQDAPGLVMKKDGATRYLKKSAGERLRGKVRPLVQSALGRTGAFDQLAKLGGMTSLLGGAGLSQDGLTDSVTDQAMNGIFTYIGREEQALRKNPLGLGRKLLQGI